VDIVASYHFGEERLEGMTRRRFIKEHFNKLGVPWEYTLEVWEEEEVHCGVRNYDEVIFKIHGKPIRRIFDEEKEREEAKRK
jgi:hypothetical protein